jgi:outer membrane protein assembly factor BamA
MGESAALTCREYGGWGNEPEQATASGQTRRRIAVRNTIAPAARTRPEITNALYSRRKTSVWRACGFALVVGLLGCSKIPPGRSAVDSIRIVNARTLGGGEIQDRIATEASAKFLYLFQGVAFDYSVYDESTLQRDMARIERFYRSKGFLDAHARVAHVLQVKKDHVRIEIVVQEGPPTLNRNVTVVGVDGLPKDVANAARLAARGALPNRERFDEDTFKGTEAAVKKALTDRGYAYATVTSDAELDLGAHVIDYGFAVTPGPRCVFGPITFQGLDPAGSRAQEIPEAPLRRAIDIRAGSPYSTAEIDSATQALLDLNVFASVQIEPTLKPLPTTDTTVPLVVKVDPVRLRQITLGGGVELDEIKTDLHLVAGWENHNFLGGLRDFAVTFKPGLVLYPYRIDNWTGTFHPLPEEWLKFQLKQPGFIEARTDAFIRPEFNIFPMLVEVDPGAHDPVVGYREVKLPIGLDRTFWKKLFVALDYTFQIENPFSYVGTLDPALQTIFLSFPELVTRLDFRDNPVNPHKGIYISNSFQVAGGIFGGSATDVRVQPEVRTYIPIARGVTFATRASLGFLFSSNYGKNWHDELTQSPQTSVPLDPTTAADCMSSAPMSAICAKRKNLERDVEITYFRGFFSGGPTTNRGFPLLGVAPHGVVPFLNPSTASQQVFFNCDPKNFTGPGGPAAIEKCYLPVGGFTLWELQNEFRAQISGPLSGSLFCDMGDVSPNQADIRLSHLHLSCGVGAAYDTPVGPIRVDIGYRIQPLQVLGFKNEGDAQNASKGGDPVNGLPPTIANLLPIAIAIGIGQAF